MFALLYGCIYQLLRRKCDMINSKWIKYIENALNDVGFCNIWASQTFSSVAWLKNAFALHVNDQYKQQFFSDIAASGKCTLYKEFKLSFGIEPYLVTLPSKLSKCLCKFRTRNHNLPIEKLCYIGIPREERKCSLFDSGMVGDEYHYLFQCPHLISARKKYISNFLNNAPNYANFQFLMTTKRVNILINLVKMIKCINTALT